MGEKMARISKDLKGLIEMLNIEEYIEEDEIEESELHLFIKAFKEEAEYMEDKRQYGYVLHSLEEILIVVILALMANCNNFVEIHLFAKKHYEWLKKYLTFECGLPSVSTFKRVIAIINPRELEEVCNEVFFKFVKSYKEKILYKDVNITIEDINSLDGKTVNSSSRITRDGTIPKTNAMSAYSVKYDRCLATEFIGKKTNEIPTAPLLLARVKVENVIFAFDALNTQRETIEYIASNGGYYVAPVKENQKNLYENLHDYFSDSKLLNDAKKNCSYIEQEKAHNHCEKRTYIFTNDIDWIYKKADWKDLKSIGIVIKEIDGVIAETRYFISNLEEKYIKLISNVVRNEWWIENKLHWYLDMAFEEDKNKCYLENSQKNLNIIRKLCLSILKIVKDEYKLSMNSIRFLLSMDFENEFEKLINNLKIS